MKNENHRSTVGNLNSDGVFVAETRWELERVAQKPPPKENVVVLITLLFFWEIRAMARILGICGSLRDKSHTRVLVQLALDSAARLGSEVELIDLRDYALPLFEAHQRYDDHAVVREVIARMREAEAYIVGTPEYHGCMSGALKNLFDFVYTEISGKLFGIVAATGGSQGVSSLDNLRACLLYCHAWVLPYNVAASGRDFDEEGRLVSESVRDRLERLGRDVAIYGPLLWNQFKHDLALPDDAPQGFAGWVA